MWKPVKPKNRNLKIFAAASFLNDLGSDMISPVWPLFVTSFTGANMQILGFIDGLGEAVVSMSQAVSGYWSDKIRKRKAFVWVGYLCAGTSRLGYSLSSVWLWLVPFRVLDRAGKMRGAPRDAMIAEGVDDDRRGRSFGILRTFDNLGAVCGIILSIWLIEKIGYVKMFALAALPSLAGAAIIYHYINEKSDGARNIYKGFCFEDIDNNMALYLALSAVFSLGAFSYSFLLVFANNTGFAAYQIPLLYLLFTLTASLFSLPFGRLSDRLKSRKGVLMISFLLWIAVCLGFISLKSPWAITAIFFVYGLHRAAIDTMHAAFISELAPPQYRASSLGFFQMITGLCALPASLGAGYVWDHWGAVTPFYVSAALAVLAALMLVFVKEKKISKPLEMKSDEVLKP